MTIEELEARIKVLEEVLRVREKEKRVPDREYGGGYKYVGTGEFESQRLDNMQEEIDSKERKQDYDY